MSQAHRFGQQSWSLPQSAHPQVQRLQIWHSAEQFVYPEQKLGACERAIKKSQPNTFAQSQVTTEKNPNTNTCAVKGAVRRAKPESSMPSHWLQQKLCVSRRQAHPQTCISFFPHPCHRDD